MGGSVLSYDDNVGDWLAATTGDRVVLVPAGDAAAAARIWASLTATTPGSDDQGTRAVLDELTADGLSRTPPFALLAWDQAVPATVSVIVRGAVRVTLDTEAGEITLTGSGVSTWVERAIHAVRGIEVCAPDAEPHAASLTLPLASGMVRTRRLQATFSPAGSAPASVATAAPASVATPRDQIGQPPTAPLPEPLPEPSSAPTPPVAEPASEQTITDIRPAGDDAAPDAAAAAGPATAGDEPSAGDAPAPLDGYDHLFGATVMRGVEQAAVRPESEDDDDAEPAAPASASADAKASASADADAEDDDDELDEPGDHDGQTIMSGDIQKLRDSQRRRPTAAAAAAVEAPQLYLLLPSGTKEPLTQPVRVGRAPSVSKVSGEHVPRLVSLGGADQDVSRNHVHFTVEGDTVVVTDLHSRNGTLVVLPGKPPQKLRQGEPTAVIVGTVVDLGSGITITVGQE